MTDIRSDEYWATQFDITQDDLKRIADRLERDGAPQDLKAIALRLIRGRLEHGHDDISPAALQNFTGQANVRLWDPAEKWQKGDLVLIAMSPSSQSPKKEIFLGEIIIPSYEKDRYWRAHIRIPDLSDEKDFVLAEPNSQEAKNWHKSVIELVESKLQSQDIHQQSEGILLRHGERILSRLAETLQVDSRFAGLEGKWYVIEKLPSLDAEVLQTVHRKAIENPGVGMSELLPGDDEATLLRRMALHYHLQHAPQKFENIGTPARPQWRARLPEPDEAQVTHFAYDPKTYEILCRPGQKLSQKKAQRLQELGLYAHVVTFAE
jgi:hypothetical protein